MSLTLLFFKQQTAYEIQGDWSSDVCSSDLSIPRNTSPLLPAITIWPGELKFAGSSNSPFEEFVTSSQTARTTSSSRPIMAEIGRASCRERAYYSELKVYVNTARNK